MKRKLIEFSWQEIARGTLRAKVIGGWIVLSQTISPREYMSESMVFVPDVQHKWEV